MQTPYQVVSAVERAVSTASSAASAVTSSVSEIVETPTVTASIGSLVKKLLLRAAGEEGVAERVAMSKPGASAYIPSAGDMEHKLEKIWERRFETHYRSEWSRVNCIDTTGEAFAIYLNLLYLAPLTWLFGRFFVRAYTARGKSGRPRSASAAAQVAADVAREAREDTEQSFEKGGMQAEDELARRSSQGKEKGEELYEQLRKDVKSMKDGTWRDRRVSERVQSYEGKVKSAAEKAKEGVKSMTNGSRSSSKSASEQKNDESAIADDTPASPAPAREGKSEDATQKESEEPAPTTKKDDESGPSNEKGEASAASDASAEAAAGSESAEKQEENLADSEATRPAPESASEGNTGDGLLGRPQSSGNDDRTYSEVVSGEGEDPSTPPAQEKAEDDTDAMGRSGVGIESEDAASSPSPPRAGNDPSTAETKAAET